MAAEAEPDLLDEVRALHDTLDPVPRPVSSAARAAFDWFGVDAELATLSCDQLVETTGLRSTSDARLMTFTAGRCTVEVQVVVENGRRHLLGQVVPIGAGEITAVVGGLEATTPLNEVGCFRFELLPAGPMRLLRRAPGQPSVVTSWVVI